MKARAVSASAHLQWRCHPACTYREFCKRYWMGLSHKFYVFHKSGLGARAAAFRFAVLWGGKPIPNFEAFGTL